jgi:hypothetical protein
VIHRLLAFAVSAAVLSSGCYLGRDRQHRRNAYIADAVMFTAGTGLVIGGGIYHVRCDTPTCERNARDYYGSGVTLATFAALLALGNYLFTPADQRARASRSPRPTNAPPVDRPE